MNKYSQIYLNKLTEKTAGNMNLTSVPSELSIADMGLFKKTPMMDRSPIKISDPSSFKNTSSLISTAPKPQNFEESYANAVGANSPSPGILSGMLQKVRGALTGDTAKGAVGAALGGPIFGNALAKKLQGR
jgi:hypothetical protein